MRSYRLTLEAQDDFREIGRYTQQRWGARQRRTYLGDMIETFEKLAENPSLGRSREEHGAGVRSLLHGRHIVFFRLVGSAVEVLRVLHQSQSTEKAFGERPFEK